MRPEFYIINDIDRPCPLLVVQTINKKGDAVYVHKDMKGWNERNGVFNLADRNPSSLKDFGFDIKIRMGGALVSFVKVAASTVLYKDGEIREWQGEHQFVLEMKPWQD